MRYRFGSLTIEAIDTYVRVTVANIGGADAKPVVRCTKKELPNAVKVAELVQEIRGYWPDDAVLAACGMAAQDAANSRLELAM